MENIDLPLIWALRLAATVFLCVAMDGFDLGVGILFPRLERREQRDLAVTSIAPVWDGNETWLVLGGGGLLAVFPLAYAIIMPALYMPLIVMLLAPVFPGVAFEMRFKQETESGKRAWDHGFWLGSTVAAFSQRIVLGATWLVRKTEGALHEVARRLARGLATATLGFMAAVSLIMPFLEPSFAQRWFRLPNLLLAWIVPVLVVVLAVILFRALAAAPMQGKRTGLLWHDAVPFGCALGLFLPGYAGLGISLWPMIVRGALTIRQAAAPPATQAFLLVGAAMLVPVILVYAGFVHWIFRGKVRPGEGYRH